MRPFSALRRATLLWLFGLAFLPLAGCDTLSDLDPTGLLDNESSKPRLQGERVSVMQLQAKLEADRRVSTIPVSLPPPVVNPDWVQPGGGPTHVQGHLALGSDLQQAWVVSIGTGSDESKLVATPIVADGKIFVLDASALISALEVGTGRVIWQVRLSPEDAREETLGGGLSYGRGVLYAATGYPEVVALDANTGAVRWRHPTIAPTRGAPTVAGDGNVYAMTLEAGVVALSAADGTVAWTQNGIAESESLLGGANPAVSGNLAFVPYSSGEIYALRTETGRPAWSDNLSAIRRAAASWSLSDILALPIVDQNRVIVTNVGGRLISIDTRTGARAWQVALGSARTPWLAGEWLFVTTLENELACVRATDGSVRWVRTLARYENPEKRRDPISWTGPVVAGNRVLLASSQGKLVEYSAADGTQIAEHELPDGVHVQPSVAGGTLYVLTDSADLLAYR